MCFIYYIFWSLIHYIHHIIQVSLSALSSLRQQIFSRLVITCRRGILFNHVVRISNKNTCYHSKQLFNKAYYSPVTAHTIGSSSTYHSVVFNQTQRWASLAKNSWFIGAKLSKNPFKPIETQDVLVDSLQKGQESLTHFRIDRESNWKQFSSV